MTEQAMTTTYNLKLGVLRRFVRIVGAAFVAGGVPGAVLAVQSPEIYELGTQLLGAAGVAVAAGALAALGRRYAGDFAAFGYPGPCAGGGTDEWYPATARRTALGKAIEIKR